MRDHLLGYPAAASPGFEAPYTWDYIERWPLGVSNRVRDTWGDSECISEAPRRPVVPRVTAASAQCLTKGDLRGLEALEQPQAALPEPSESGWLVTVGHDCIDEPAAVPRETLRPVYTKPEVRTLELRPVGGLGVRRVGVDDRVPAVEPRTISEAAMWPFAGCGWRNGDGGLGEQQERVRLEKLKAAEHQRWLAQQMYSSQQMYANEKGKP